MEPTIYLFFKGNCLEAMSLYADILHGQIQYVFRNGDAPDDQRMPGGDDVVMNMSMKLGNATIMASDNSDEMYDKPQGFCVSIPIPSAEEFDRVYARLSKDAEQITMPPEETFWADRFAMFRDRFGIPWMLNFTGSKATQQ
ncbi:glyoxalase/bleomycin resistance/extradiol dioxygenase family protein [Paracoccus sp. 11-3]|uniref:Glyoxalase/bleomycin resistance/extradiol dioxygenase family protein n=1 Tax=Paracoccus amoyensis TaxID=2760093 RepID=A0A926GE55_9RHOB|nr:glyoxalase/bleomycin resistance/extradiol dioxygenase family protein [Paracoccus amoyensis]MBC9246662.1 glyoxalase/bleomycin resistance/extradiol dioxygenase family protein [Paracoccus amoyensis]